MLGHRVHHLIFKPNPRPKKKKLAPTPDALPQVTKLPPVTSLSELRRQEKEERERQESEIEDTVQVVDYSKIKPPLTSDPEKILFWYATNFMSNSKSEFAKARINVFRPPFSELVRVEFFELVPHGMKLIKREVTGVTNQAALHNVKPGWIVLSIWLHEKMIFSPMCPDPKEQLSTAVTSNLPYTICFFKDAALWKRINAAIKFVKEFQHQKKRREALHNIPCASIRLDLPPIFSQNKNPEVLSGLKEAVSDVLKSCEVHKRDVRIQKGSTKTVCTIQVNGDVAVSSVHEKLDEALTDGSLEKAIKSNNADPGAAKGQDILGAARVSIKWPLNRIHESIRVEHQYTLEKEQLEELVKAVTASRDVYAAAWAPVRSSEADAVAAVLDIEPMSCFQVQDDEIKLVAISEARAQALKMQWVAQEAGDLAELVTDAKRAQKMLKTKLCPSEAKDSWGQTRMNDIGKCPLSDNQRTWVSGAEDLAPNGSHFDPGIKNSDRVLQKAKSKQTALDDEPPVRQLVDVSRVGIIFDSVASLLQALQKILKDCEVVWLDNTFRNPSCIGDRQINIGVRQQLRTKEGAGRKHISEVQLLNRSIYNAQTGDGHKHYKTIENLLSKFGVKREQEFAVLKTILRELDTTSGKAALEEIENAEKLRDFITAELPEESPELLKAVDNAVKHSKALVDKHNADEAEARLISVKKEVVAWNALGDEGGGTVKGVHYTKQKCYLKSLELDPGYALAWSNFGAEGGGTVKGVNYTEMQCFLKAVELDDDCAVGWSNLGLQGGGTVKGVNYTSTECVLKALELNPSLASAWRTIGMHGGGDVKGANYTSKDCYLKALDLDSGDALAWNGLGTEGGGSVRGSNYMEKDCYLKSVELDPTIPAAWNNLGLREGGTVKGTNYPQEQCFSKAVQLDPGYSLAWANLGFCKNTKDKTQGLDCYLKALELDPDCAIAWNALPRFVMRNLDLEEGEEEEEPSVKVNDAKYTRKDCYMKALEADPVFIVAWINLEIEGGGMVQGVSYEKDDCRTKAQELDPIFAIEMISKLDWERFERGGVGGNIVNSGGKIVTWGRGGERGSIVTESL